MFGGQQGTVTLLLEIGTDGRVLTLRVERSSGHPILDATARRAVVNWCYRPAMRDGQPVPGQVRTAITFRLD
ncbi:MAG: energy transducer TonB [Acetobacteraceae bacterium]|nr:energy transducer TonB [Acetobacteraceae bacterium]